MCAVPLTRSSRARTAPQPRGSVLTGGTPRPAPHSARQQGRATGHPGAEQPDHTRVQSPPTRCSVSLCPRKRLPGPRRPQLAVLPPSPTPVSATVRAGALQRLCFRMTTFKEDKRQRWPPASASKPCTSLSQRTRNARNPVPSPVPASFHARPALRNPRLVGDVPSASTNTSDCSSRPGPDLQRRGPGRVHRQRPEVLPRAKMSGPRIQLRIKDVSATFGQ